MFGFSAERPMVSWLLDRLGPPAPPPRRHFSKSWDSGPQHWAARLPGLALGAGGRGPQPRDDPAETR